VILTQQTCGQRSSRAAENKRRAPGDDFPKQICYMILLSKCRRDRDLSLCTISVLAFGEPMRNGNSRRNTCFARRKIGIWHCAAVLFLQVPKLCTNLDLSLFYILIIGTYSKFALKNTFLALGVWFPQPCSSAGRRFAASRSRLQNYRRIVSFPQQKSRWNALWTGFHWESVFVREIPNPTLTNPLSE